MKDKVRKFLMGKLIREKLAHILEEKGIKLDKKILSKEERKEELKNKLQEEAEEVKEASSEEALIEELADVLEVLKAIADVNGISFSRIEEARVKKLEIKGGFNSGIYVHSVEIEETSPLINYFKNKEEKYPEILEV